MHPSKMKRVHAPTQGVRSLLRKEERREVHSNKSFFQDRVWIYGELQLARQYVRPHLSCSLLLLLLDDPDGGGGCTVSQNNEKESGVHLNNQGQKTEIQRQKDRDDGEKTLIYSPFLCFSLALSLFRHRNHIYIYSSTEES